MVYVRCSQSQKSRAADVAFFGHDAQIEKVISNLTEQYKSKETDFENFKRDYNVRPAAIA